MGHTKKKNLKNIPLCSVFSIMYVDDNTDSHKYF